jgi:hypothetical protein
MRLPAMVAGLGVAVVVAGYIGTPWRSAGAAPDESSSAGASAPSVPPAQTQVVATVLANADRASQSATPVEELPAKAPQPTATRRPAKAARPEPAPPTLALATGDIASTIEPAAPLAEPEPPPVKETPPDRWQLLADALVKCENETFLANVICVQRARWQYCDGYWGKVAQCPVMNSSYER